MTARLTALSCVAAIVALCATVPAFATDEDVRTIVRDGSARIVAAERNVLQAAQAFDKQPVGKALRRFRAAARREAAVVRDLRRDLLAAEPDTEPVRQGRGLMAKGLDRIAVSLEAIDRALALATRGQERKARRATRKALRGLVRGNRDIEKAEPLVGAELTPAEPVPSEPAAPPAPA